MITTQLQKLLQNRPNQTVFRVIITPTPGGTSRAKSALEQAGKDINEVRSGGQTIFETKLSRKEINNLSGVSQIEQIDHNPTFQLFGVSQLVSENEGTNYISLKESCQMLNVESAWESANKGDGAAVGIIDSPVDANHPAIAENIVKQEGPTDPETHGTWVAGCIAASDYQQDGYTIRGMAPDCDLYTHGGLAGGGASVATVVDAIGWCIDQDVDVINMSLGGPHSTALQDATQRAVDNDIVVVSSAGNAGPSPDSIGCPAHHDSNVAVASVTSDRETSLFSSRGPGFEDTPKPDVAAPGGDVVIADNGAPFPKEAIYSTAPGSDIAPNIGTSMACPHVAGMVALGSGADEE